MQGWGQGRALTCRGLESDTPAEQGLGLAIYPGSLQGQGSVPWGKYPPLQGWAFFVWRFRIYILAIMEFLAISELHTDRTEANPSGSAYNSNTKSPMPARSSHRGGHAAATATAAIVPAIVPKGQSLCGIRESLKTHSSEML